MLTYVVRRLLYGVLTFFGITIAIFVLVHSVPGDAEYDPPPRHRLPRGRAARRPDRVMERGAVRTILIDQARHELDHSTRVAIYRQLHAVLADDQPYTWTVQVSTKWAIAKRVKNVKESKGWGLYLWYPGEVDWWIPKSQQR